MPHHLDCQLLSSTKQVSLYSLKTSRQQEKCYTGEAVLDYSENFYFQLC